MSSLRAGVMVGLLTAMGVPYASARVELRPCKNDIPAAQQIELGTKSEQQVYPQMPVLPASSPVVTSGPTTFTWRMWRTSMRSLCRAERFL